jgi:hypothetical protein
MSELYTCPNCHAQSSKYWHPVSSGIIDALVKFKRAFIEKNRNTPDNDPLIGVHTRRDMDGTENELNKSHYANWTMLRYHGLVAKDKKQGKGYWMLTRRGSEFLKGNEAIPCRVQVMNNEVIDHDYSRMVNVRQVIGSVPYFNDEQTIERERVPVAVAQSMFELDVQPVQRERSYGH